MLRIRSDPSTSHETPVRLGFPIIVHLVTSQGVIYSVDKDTWFSKAPSAFDGQRSPTAVSQSTHPRAHRCAGTRQGGATGSGNNSVRRPGLWVTLLLFHTFYLFLP